MSTHAVSVPEPGRLARAWHAVRTSPLLGEREFVAGALLLALLVACAVVGPLVWRIDPLAIDLEHGLEAPSWAHPMGTDNSGRDILARFMEGARISLGISLLVTVGGALVGGAMGLIAGMGSGLVDGIMARAIDSLLAFPTLILAMTVTIGFGAGLPAAALGVMLASVPLYARMMRGEVLRIRNLPHVEAANALGAHPLRVAIRHVVPYTMTTMLIQAATVFGLSILNLAALGYVGLGARVPTPEWGAMITDGQQYTLTGHWWVAVCPGIGLIVAAVAVNLVVDSLRDRFDPRGIAAGGA